MFAFSSTGALSPLLETAYASIEVLGRFFEPIWLRTVDVDVVGRVEGPACRRNQAASALVEVQRIPSMTPSAPSRYICMHAR